MQTLLTVALDMFPEGHARVAAAQQRRAQQPTTAIRRHGPISKYGIPYAAPMTDDGAADAVAGVKREYGCDGLPYLPYDPETGELVAAASMAATVAAALPTGAKAVAVVKEEEAVAATGPEACRRVEGQVKQEQSGAGLSRALSGGAEAAKRARVSRGGSKLGHQGSGGGGTPTAAAAAFSPQHPSVTPRRASGTAKTSATVQVKGEDPLGQPDLQRRASLSRSSKKRAMAADPCPEGEGVAEPRGSGSGGEGTAAAEAEGAVASDEPRLGPRQALLLAQLAEEQEEREEQRRAAEGMRQARAQRAARRNQPAGATPGLQQQQGAQPPAGLQPEPKQVQQPAPAGTSGAVGGGSVEAAVPQPQEPEPLLSPTARPQAAPELPSGPAPAPPGSPAPVPTAAVASAPMVAVPVLLPVGLVPLVSVVAQPVSVPPVFTLTAPELPTPSWDASSLDQSDASDVPVPNGDAADAAVPTDVEMQEQPASDPVTHTNGTLNPRPQLQNQDHAQRPVASPFAAAAAEPMSPTGAAAPVAAGAAVMAGAGSLGRGRRRSGAAPAAAPTAAPAAAPAALAVEEEARLDPQRSVRPRRERRVPKHLLDEELELTEEIQHIMAGAGVGAGGMAGAPAAAGVAAAEGAQPAAEQAVATAGAAAAAAAAAGADVKAGPAGRRQEVAGAAAAGAAAAAAEPAAAAQQGSALQPQKRQKQEAARAANGAGVAAPAAESGLVSPRRSSRPTRPSSRVLDLGASVPAAPAPTPSPAPAPAPSHIQNPVQAQGAAAGSSGGSGSASASASACTSATASGGGPVQGAAPPLSVPSGLPGGVMLLRKETTSGPSTGLRTSGPAVRRLPPGQPAVSLPPTTHAATRAQEQAQSLASPKAVTLSSPRALPVGTTTFVSRAAPARQEPAAAGQEPAPGPARPPNARAHADSQGGAGAAAPTPAPAAMHSAAPDGPAGASASAYPSQLFQQPSATPSPGDAPAASGAAAPAPAPAAGAPMSARPVRKRRTALSEDMVVYGETAPLFGGQAPASKRRNSADRKGATAAAGGAAAAAAAVGATSPAAGSELPTCSGSGTGTGAGTGDVSVQEPEEQGRCEGRDVWAKGGVPGREAALLVAPVHGGMEAESLVEEEHAEDADHDPDAEVLNGFADDLRPLASGLSPPHALYPDMHCTSTTMTPPPVLLLLPPAADGASVAAAAAAAVGGAGAPAGVDVAAGARPQAPPVPAALGRCHPAAMQRGAGAFPNGHNHTVNGGGDGGKAQEHDDEFVDVEVSAAPPSPDLLAADHFGEPHEPHGAPQDHTDPFMADPEDRHHPMPSSPSVHTLDRMGQGSALHLDLRQHVQAPEGAQAPASALPAVGAGRHVVCNGQRPARVSDGSGNASASQVAAAGAGEQQGNGSSHGANGYLVAIGAVGTGQEAAGPTGRGQEAGHVAQGAVGAMASRTGLSTLLGSSGNTAGDWADLDDLVVL